MQYHKLMPTLPMPSNILADDDLIFVLDYFLEKKNKDLAFYVNRLLGRHEMPSLIFSEKHTRKEKRMLSATILLSALTLKTPRKSVSENVICLCRLLNILANFSNLFLHTGKHCGP